MFLSDPRLARDVLDDHDVQGLALGTLERGALQLNGCRGHDQELRGLGPKSIMRKYLIGNDGRAQPSCDSCIAKPVIFALRYFSEFNPEILKS